MATEKVTQRLVPDFRLEADTGKIKNNFAESGIQLFGSPVIDFAAGEQIQFNKNLFVDVPDSFKSAEEKTEGNKNIFAANIFQKLPAAPSAPALHSVEKMNTEKLAPLKQDKFEQENPVNNDRKSILSHRLLKWFKRPNALSKLSSEEDIKTAVASNPRIGQILYEAGVPLVINYENLKGIKEGHLNDTVEYSRALAKKLGLSKEQIETVEVAAAFHDIGKSLIPAEYLNKNGALSKDERRIVNLHAVMGYELMKSLGFKPEIAEAVRDHHNPNSKNELAQILRMADIYSAMTEERPYKPARSHYDAMRVLRDCKLPDNLIKLGNVLKEAHDDLHGPVPERA